MHVGLCQPGLIRLSRITGQGRLPHHTKIVRGQIAQMFSVPVNAAHQALSMGREHGLRVRELRSKVRM